MPWEVEFLVKLRVEEELRPAVLREEILERLGGLPRRGVVVGVDLMRYSRKEESTWNPPSESGE